MQEYKMKSYDDGITCWILQRNQNWNNNQTQTLVLIISHLPLNMQWIEAVYQKQNKNEKL